MLNAALLAGLNHLLQGANWARMRLVPFAGRTARIEMPPLRLDFVIGSTGFLEAGPTLESSGQDVTLHLPADTPLQLLNGIDKALSVARVEGNAEFATELSFIFRNLRWDAEEDLSHVIGDIAAHRLVEGASLLATWQRQFASHLAANLAEYLTFENPLLLPGREFADFRGSIQSLNQKLDQLEVRTKRLV